MYKVQDEGSFDCDARGRSPRSCGGLILEFMVSRFENLTVFQPVINGVGGNLVAVQASRISTALHKQAELGTLLIPPGHTHPVIFVTPIANFFGKGISLV